MSSFSHTNVFGRFDGVLLVDKPVGPTSHDIVHKIRKTFRIEKVGHGGTLDPNATGLLLLLLGKGTKLSNQLMGSDKAYAGVMHLGRTTASQDCDGELLVENPWQSVMRAQVETEMVLRTGDIFQIPPMVSAIKMNGTPLYKLARKGYEVERKSRLVHIYKFEITDWTPPLVAFNVLCTKGTYVRTLAHDVGQAIGCGACLDGLRRMKSGAFDVQDALPFDEVLRLTPEELANRIIPFIKIIGCA